MSCSSNKQDDSLLTTRGVKNPKVIDLIKFDEETESVILIMIEDRAWIESEERLEELSAKFNSYFDYVVDGWLIKQYPQYEGKSVTFELSCKNEPSGFFKSVCEQISSFSKKSGFSFQVQHGELI